MSSQVWELLEAQLVRKAIAVAQYQHAKALVLRAVLSLVRLRRQQGTHHAARTALAEAHTM